MSTFDEWLNSVPEYREYRAAEDARIAAMSPEDRERYETLMASSLDMALYGEVFFTADGEHVPRNDVRL